MATPLINKALFLAGWGCRTRAWLARHEPLPTQHSANGADWRRKEGIRIGQLARELFPDGHLVEMKSIAEAAKLTTKLIQDPAITTLFEATFVAGGFVTRADILVRVRRGWHLIEVKMAVNESQEQVDDLAYTTFVLTKAGISVTAMSLLLLSRDYRLGQPAKDLFAPLLDRSSEVKTELQDLAKAADEIEAAVNSPDRPNPELTKICKSCEFFETRCLGQGVDHHVLTLPRLSDEALDNLKSRGITSIKAIDDSVSLTPQQEIVRRAVGSGRPEIDRRQLRKLLKEVQWPAAYLDFESVQTPLPRLSGIGPYEQMPTQFSVHLCPRLGEVEEHFEFLASPDRDDRLPLLQALVSCLEDAKSIIVYSGFERTMLLGLAEQFPKLARDVAGCLERVFDLSRAMRPAVFYHPEFHGRYSVKVVLPVLVPGFRYDDLGVQDGDDAIGAFVRLLDGDCTRDEREEIRRNLLAYCKHDTLAMVKLHAVLVELVKPRVRAIRSPR